MRGVLQVDEGRVDGIHRMCRVAKLIGPKGEIVLPVLHDAVLLFAREDLWSMNGYEFGETNGVAISFGQTWFLVPASYFEEEKVRNAESERLIKLHQANEPPITGHARVWKSRR